MIARRDALGGMLAMIVPAMVPTVARAATLPVPSSNRLGFDVWRGTRKLGTHDLVFHAQGDGLVVDVAVDIAFRVGPLTLFRYTHTARERWIGDRVVDLATQTNENGTRYRLEARRDHTGFIVHPEGHAAYTAPDNALPATHWNHRELDGPWINTQNGELVRPIVAPQGMIVVTNADDKPLRVRKFALSGPVHLDLWYDEAQAWAGLSFVKGGAEVRYARRS